MKFGVVGASMLRRALPGSMAVSMMGLLATPAPAQQAPEPPSAAGPPGRMGAVPAPFRPDAVEGQPDVWIFSGELQNSHESFSGTLVAAKPDKGDADKGGSDKGGSDKGGSDKGGPDKNGKAGATAQFELKLAGGATCDGSNMSGDVGLVRLDEITCSDDRVMRALFVPQGGQELKVFGHVGDERFVASAHLLGSEAAPEKAQTAQPTAPKVQGPAEGTKPEETRPEEIRPEAAPR